MICQLVRNARPTLSKPGVLYAVLLGVTWRGGRGGERREVRWIRCGTTPCTALPTRCPRRCRVPHFRHPPPCSHKACVVGGALAPPPGLLGRCGAPKHVGVIACILVDPVAVGEVRGVANRLGADVVEGVCEDLNGSWFVSWVAGWLAIGNRGALVGRDRSYMRKICVWKA